MKNQLTFLNIARLTCKVKNNNSSETVDMVNMMCAVHATNKEN